MSRFASILGLWEQLASADIAVWQHRCAVVRNRNARCRRCAEACTTGCIHTEDGQLRLEAERCVGCGTCATVCPTGALCPTMPDDDELFEACRAACAAAGGQAVVACEHAVEAARGELDAEKVVGVTCLGRVDESLLVRLVDGGARAVTLVHGDCAACALAPGKATAQSVVETVNALLGLWNKGVPVALRDRFPAVTRCASEPAYDVARRELFGSLKQRLKSAAVTAVEAAAGEGAPTARRGGEAQVVRVTEKGTLPAYLPPRRTTLLEVLRRWGLPEDALVSTRLWGHVTINTQRCTSCRMCATFCPTAALSRYDAEDGTFGVAHAPSLCVACGTCQSVCPVGALRVTDEVRSGDLVAGFVERIQMEPPAYERQGPHSATNAMRHILGTSKIYER